MGREVDKVVLEFVDRLRSRYDIAKVILFGSRARNDALLSSDYDLIIVSADFANVPFVKRSALISSLWSAPQHLEALCYTPDEFERKAAQLSIVRVAVEEGIEIAA